ncbi:MAG: PQQ-binding-like beta-propeller repeat protein [Chthoniobacter sp.]|uniref:outer membrane protein assembly factor BamB family protein n=1 Tax=Chthoniobacter sp. TaxID=2510640 RepID=UPI0032A5624A
MRFLVPALAFTATLQLHAVDWPQYRGPSGDGKSSEKITVPAGKTAPKQVWKTPSEGGFSSFVVAKGRAFTLSLKDAEGTKQESVVAYDAKTGKELWFAALNFPKYDGGGDSGAADNKGGDGPRSTPTTDGTTVYVMSSQLVLRTFDAATGKPGWSHDLLKEFAGRNIQWENAASPLIEGSLVLVGGGGPGESLIAFNAKDGSVAWKAFDEKITHATPVAATILGQRQVIFFLQSGLLAVEPQTGKELWRYAFDYKTSTAASPVVDGDVVYCSAGYGVGAGAVRVSKDANGLKATELYRIRTNKPLANHWSTPIVKDGYLYGMFQFKEYGVGPVKCVDIKTGAVKWEQPGFGPGQVILVGDRVLALADNGDLVTFEAKPDAYHELSRAKVLDGKCWTTPIVSNGMIFARSTKEAVCLDVSGR